nr:glycosyltransferase [Patulibacter sp. SYSU D01012]
MSVCIPTHDGRRDALAEALAALTDQLGPQHAGRVEICVTDNASADGTEELVARLARVHPIVYRRHDRDLGAGRNVLAAAALGAGDWLWLHSSDDAVVPGAIDAVLAWVEHAPALAGLSLGRARWDQTMRFEIEPEPAALRPDDPDRRRIFRDPREAIAQTGLMQTYLTSTVIRRGAWIAAVARDPDRPLRVAPNFPHTYVVGRALLDGAGGWGWEPRKLVRTRTTAEPPPELGGSHVAAGVSLSTQVERLWRALLGPRDATLARLRERLRQVWAPPEWIEMVKLGPQASTATDLRLLGLVRPLWRLPRFWTRTAPRLALPHLLLHAVRSARLRVPPMRAVPAGCRGGARIAVEGPTRVEVGTFVSLRCTLEAGDGPALRTALPAPVYLDVAWRGSPDGGGPATLRRALPRPVRRGRPVVMEVMTSAPWQPGDHELTVALVQEDGAGNAIAEVAPAHVATVHVVPRPRDDGFGPWDEDPPDAEAEDERLAALRTEVDRIETWWHSIDLGGVVTPGVKTPELLRTEQARLRLPDLRGRTVLDVGAWDDFYAFAAERAGAARVVALDHLVWSIEVGAFTRAWTRALADLPPGRRPPDALDVARASDDWDPVGLPGRAGFDLAHRTLGSAVEPVVLDFAHDDLDPLGRFDVVLFLGVLYHLRDPLDALRRVHARCDELAIIETEAIAIGGHPDAAAAQFMGTRKRLGDPTNWWAPTAAGLERWCLAAGFSRVERVSGRLPTPPAGTTTPCRVTVHAWR